MSWFRNDLTTLAFCWRIDRCDGVTIGLTSHDRDLWFNDLCHRAAPGMIPSAVESGRGMAPTSVDLSGAITSDALSQADLAAGLWDGARLTLYAVDWQAPDIAPVFLVRGTLGQVETEGAGFTVELSGGLGVLDRRVTETTSPQCRADLGDRRCRVDLRARRVVDRCVAADGHLVTVAQAYVDGRFSLGRLRWLGGPLAAQAATILDQQGATLTLADPVPPGVSGHLFELVEGCDRTLATCTARFANALNFQGEPHLPGNDLLTRYGG